MTDPGNQLFEFAPLSQYSLKQRISILAADILFFLLINLLGSTARFEVRGAEHFETVEAAGQLPIYTFWHDRILLGTYYFRRRGIVIMTSKSFDGEYIARFIQRLGYGAIRGSSSRGGARALVKMIKSMRDGHPMGFALDGPRGPRHEVKPGPVILAKKTGNPIIPFVFEPRRFRTLKSWDKMQIPWPFTRTLLVIGKPIYVDAHANDSEVEEKLQQLQSELDSLTHKAAQWRRNG